MSFNYDEYSQNGAQMAAHIDKEFSHNLAEMNTKTVALEVAF